MEISVLSIDGSDVGKKTVLPREVFGVEPNDHSVYLGVKQYLAHQRRGTHSSKERNEVAGSTRKLKKQKGTGSARSGDIKNPLFVGGGRVFGPEPRSYAKKLNKNLKKLALRSAFSIKAKEGSIIVIDSMDFNTPKTKSFVGHLKSLGVEGRKSLFVLAEPNNAVYLASRNLKKVSVVQFSDLSVYGVMAADRVIIVLDSLSEINKKWGAV